MTKDLTADLQQVFAARGVEAKKAALLQLIENSYGKTETKRLRSSQAAILNNENKIDRFATNYALSGEGMKVR